MTDATFDRQGELVSHGQDYRGRHDGVEFVARSGEPTIDWLAEAFVWVERWGTREGVAMLYEADGETWALCAKALPYDALYVVRETELRLVFSQWIRMQPAHRYRLVLAGAVVSRPVVGIVALVKPVEIHRPTVRRGFRKVRR